MTPSPARVAVTRCRKIDDYLEALRRAGAEPIVVDADGDPPLDVLGRVVGLVLTGGGDVDPQLYGERRGPHTEPADPDRDAFEIELAVRAIERNVPLLAICRGMQVLNVACGGTLIQHIPDDVPRPLVHQVSSPPDAIAHDVEVAAASRLAEILEPVAGRHPVNSRHHQAVKHLAPGLVTVATAADGIIEAVERPGLRFCIGVQWHPENFWRTGEFDTLFRAFTSSCRP